MNLATALIEHFLNTPFQMFTEKLVSAFMISEVISFDKKDLSRLKFIETETAEDINVSLYQIDRFVNPSRGEFRTKVVQKEFSRTKYDKLQKRFLRITIPEDQAQKLLCTAIREVCQIVSKNIKDYNDEMKMPKFETEYDGVENGFKR